MNGKVQQGFLLLLIGSAFILALFIIVPFLAPLALAAVAAVIVRPLYLRLLSSLRSPGLSALVTVIVSVIIILVPLSLIGAQIAREAQQLYDSLTAGSGTEYVSRALESVQNVISQYVPISGFSQEASADIDAYLKQGLAWLIGNLGSIFSSVASLLLNFLIFFIALFYLLRDGPFFKQRLIELSPLSDADDESIFSRLELAVNSVVKGNLAIVLIQGLLTAVGFTLFGVPHAVLWGSVAAVAALIPGFGTALVIVPAVIFLFATGNSAQAIGLLAWGILAVGLIDNFLGPRIVGRGMKMHPLLVLLSVLGGIVFFGPLGIFLGPLTLSLLFALISIHSLAAKSQQRAL